MDESTTVPTRVSAMSSKSVAEKLKIKPGNAVWSSSPASLDLIGPLPTGVRIAAEPTGATVTLMFAPDAASVRGILATHPDDFAASSCFWVAYPKGNRTDINRDTLWPILGEHNMRPVTQVAIDDVWSAMQFRANREGEAPFTGGR
jgi:hypothetical protein